MNGLEKSYQEKVDKLEALLVELPEADCPLRHTFTPGLYTREVFLPAGSLVTSKIHKTEHPFILAKGKVVVLTDCEVIHLEAPYCGVTKPGTRRVVYVIEDTVWLTIHATDKATPQEVEDEIIEKYNNPLIKKEEICHS